MSPRDPLGVVETLAVGAKKFQVYRADKLQGLDRATLERRPLVVRILLENLLRDHDAKVLEAKHLVDLGRGTLGNDVELPFHPGRVLLQDFTGVPVVVDLTAMRGAAGKDQERVNPRVPVDLVIDHSVQVDSFAQPRSRLINLDREYERNSERYAFLRWSQGAYRGLRVVPPGNGICHQVNLEYLASVVDHRPAPGDGATLAFPDTLVGTDSHTTMVNGLGVLGWGVGGIEAEAVMLGEPYFMSRPTVVGVRLTGALPEGATATDLVLTVTKALRAKGVVEKFVEFWGPGVRALSVPDRATISNMCPEYGATAALFPIDEATLAYLRGTARSEEQVALVEAYAKAVGLWVDASTKEPQFDETLEIDLTKVVPTMSGPRNPEEAVPLPSVPQAYRSALETYRKGRPAPEAHPGPLSPDPPNDPRDVLDGAVAIAAITSCTNTSNPNVMVGAGLIAKRAHERGLHPPWWVKTSLAPGSKVVSDYLERSGLLPHLSALGFGIVGYGCTTCIGNSGPLIPEVEEAFRERDVYLAAVLSGNRNFEARIHNEVRANFLASPMLVVAYALAGRVDLDLTREALGKDKQGRPVLLKDLWPTADEVRKVVDASLEPGMYRTKYAAIADGGDHWNHLKVPTSASFAWEEDSTYLREPPYFVLPPPSPPKGREVLGGARALALLGDNVSTDHISPAGEIPEESAAGSYLKEHGVAPADFNTYGSRRGNHEVMARGTFANVRLKNALAPMREGGWTLHVPSGKEMTFFDASEEYRRASIPLIVLAGNRYGQGSSRDWAAKGPLLLGVRAVIAQSYERIHRSNLVGMGVLPLEFKQGESWKGLGISGKETFSLLLPEGKKGLEPRGELELVVRDEKGSELRRTRVRVRIDSKVEIGYYRAGGILPYVLGRLRAP
ncbi:MAG: aconitate hydratase AcnA [Euryarchaeota archaeon]|nr:aconitate hydratase AcnA [Euryarchaeota archaeon]